MAEGNSTEGNEKTHLISADLHIPAPGWGKRHVVVILSFLGMSISYILRVNLSVALVAMVRSPQLEESLTNSSSDSSTDTCPDGTTTNSSRFQPGEFNWDASTQGIILSSFFYGYITTQLIGGQLAQHIGGRVMFGLGIGVTALLTILTPVLARADVKLLIAARVVEGIAEGVTLPAMYVMLSKWTPKSELSRFGAITLSGNNFGTAFATPVTGLLCQYGFAGGWPSSFYVLGGLGVLWVIVFVIFTVETPEKHKSISMAELKYILNTTGSRTKRQRTPWKSILTSVAVWAAATGHTTKNWAYYTLLTTLPSYLKQVLRFDISQNGIISALPFLCMTLLEIVGGVIADKIRTRRLLTTLGVRRTFTALGCYIPCILLVVEGFVGCNQLAAIVVLCVSTGFIGFASSGVMVNHYDIAPKHAGTVMGISNTLATIPGMVAPSIVEAITDAKPYFTRWRWVFILSSIIYTLGGTTFIIFGSAEEQEWAKATEHKTEGTEEDRR